jgi:hypothetical protein
VKRIGAIVEHLKRGIGGIALQGNTIARITRKLADGHDNPFDDRIAEPIKSFFLLGAAGHT